jgi:hypothetical protein
MINEFGRSHRKLDGATIAAMSRSGPPASMIVLTVLAMSVGVPMAAANIPPPPFCEVNPGQCHAFVGRTRAHFLGMLQQVIRALPKVPGYRCNVETRLVDEGAAYGSRVDRAAPERMIQTFWCFHRGTDPRKRYPDIEMSVQLSMVALAFSEGEPRQKEPNLLVFAGPKGVSFIFGKLREWRDAKGVVHRGYDPSIPSRHTAEEVVANGPYLVTAVVGINAESPVGVADLDAFARGFDRASVSKLMAREEQRRKADPRVGSIAGALP